MQFFSSMDYVYTVLKNMIRVKINRNIPGALVIFKYLKPYPLLEFVI